MTEQGGTPAGWYPDPWDSSGGGLRWWDGAQWTSHVSAQAAAPSSEAPSRDDAAHSDAARDPAAKPRRWLLPAAIGVVAALVIGGGIVVARTLSSGAEHGASETAAPYEYSEAVKIDPEEPFTVDTSGFEWQDPEWISGIEKNPLRNASGEMSEAIALGFRSNPVELVQVFADPSLTQRVAYRTVADYDDASKLSIIPQTDGMDGVRYLSNATTDELTGVSGDDDIETQLDKREKIRDEYPSGVNFTESDETSSDGWWSHDTYWVVSYYTSSGEPRERPLVTPVHPQVERSLDTPENLTVSTPRPDGTVDVSWDPVEGATGYAVLSSSTGPMSESEVEGVSEGINSGFTEFSIIGQTGDTNWNSAMTAGEMNPAGNTDSAYQQNQGLKASSNTDDDLLAGETYDIADPLYDQRTAGIANLDTVAIGVVAFTGAEAGQPLPEHPESSAITTKTLIDNADVRSWDALPVEVATANLHQDEAWGSIETGFWDTPENLEKNAPSTMPVVTIDGSVRRMRVTVEKTGEYVHDYRGIYVEDESGKITNPSYSGWNLVFRGEGTALQIPVGIEVPESFDIDGYLKELNTRFQDEVAGGQPVVVPPPVDVDAYDDMEAVSDEPVTPYDDLLDTEDQYSSPLARFLAGHVLLGTQKVDVTEFRDDDEDMDEFRFGRLEPAIGEVQAQTFLDVSLSNWQIEADGKKTYVDFSYFDRDGMDELTKSTYDRAEQVADEIIADGMTDADKVTAINDWLVDNVEYDTALSKEPMLDITADTAYGFNADGALLDGKTMCQGYATAFGLLAQIAGVPVVEVTGTVTGADHAWNKVMIDGDWKAVDATWNDTPEGENAYLMIPDSEFTGNAERSESSDWWATGTEKFAAKS